MRVEHRLATIHPAEEVTGMREEADHATRHAEISEAAVLADLIRG
jgi:hypothetical protein